MNTVDRKFGLSWGLALFSGVSALAFAGPAVAQEPVETTQAAEEDDTQVQDTVYVSGIRASLASSLSTKRDADGIVDAITAEDIGKFPDQNLAESLQRITGVSVDRSLGEGASVTVRGFGQDFNLVTFNGRLMPTSTLGDGASAPASRNFDFGNLASEAISAVEVFKTSKASVPTGGIGATINIRTTRPLEGNGMSATVAVKGVYDESSIDDPDLTPEISGLYSNQYLDGRLGFAVSGSYQERSGGVAQANVGWRDGYLGSSDFDGEWGALPREGSWNFIDGTTNRPGDTDVYAVPQNADYELAEFTRKRTNGQVTLQYDFTDNIRGTADYTYSHNQVELQRNTVGIWFNHGFTNSAWTDGPVAGPLFYTEFLGNSDLSYSGALLANESENKSFGLNLEWNVTDRFSLTFDAHDSSAESKPGNDFGSSMSLGSAVLAVDTQTINFENDLPIISVTQNPDLPDLFSASSILGTGSSFRNAYVKDDILETRVYGSYDFDHSLIDSVDFGVGYLENEYKSRYGFIQTDSWGGLGTADDYPDDIWTAISLADQFDGISGAGDPNMIQTMFRADIARLADLMESQFGICSSPWTGSPIGPDTCLATQDTDDVYVEEILSAFVQYNNTFDLFGRDATLNAGFRYEETDVTSTSLQPNPVGTNWTGLTEIGVTFDGQDTLSVDGSYDHFLPSIDFAFEPIDYVKIRTAYSQTITRPSYNNLRASLNLQPPFRPEEARAAQGNAGLEPFESENFDISAEWYYADDSYLSLAYFTKDVTNFIGTTEFDQTFPGLTNPARGPRYDAAIAALGADAGAEDIRNYIIANFPDTVDANGGILGQPDDPLFQIRTTVPFNNDESLKYEGLEFAVQHIFGDTGFGAIFNYTVALDADEYDNTLSFRDPQFVVKGWSDSANIIAFYEKYGFQARLAYNWREMFLDGDGPNPFYIEDYGQLDGNVSYEFDNGVSIFAEGINITGEDRRGHRRSSNNVFFVNNGQPRWSFGARYKF
ncbi:MAG: TonB-dependent receptor [Pseudomonadota bacterium]